MLDHTEEMGAVAAVKPCKIVVIASASGNGKTTLARELAARLDVTFVELDALVHGPDWTETPDAELVALLAPVIGSDGWVIDGDYQHKLGTTVLDQADLVVWLDLPIRTWLPRLLKRSVRRWTGQEQLWNGNRETLKGLFWGRYSLFGYALRRHFSRRREYPVRLSRYNLRRLRTTQDVERLCEEIG